MRHRDDQPRSAVHQLLPLAGQAQRKQEIVEEAIFLQDDCPGRRAHQDRRPEGQQNEDESDAGFGGRQIDDEMGERKGQHERRQGDDRRNDEGSDENPNEDRFARRQGCDRAVSGPMQVECVQEKEGGEAIGSPADDRPGLLLAEKGRCLDHPVPAQRRILRGAAGDPQHLTPQAG